ncbi:MAG: trp operon repressor [Spirochaetaceae bacterium]|jgi:TrpR family trp operon transcriptional repressor|nr:trp operon repressor [Spirochaetaceae bacterium]
MDENTIQTGLHDMYRALALAGDEQLIADFFECLLTPAERVDVAKRWLLVREIDQGTSQRQIAKKLGISLCKITRGSSELKKPDSAFRRMFALGKH